MALVRDPRTGQMVEVPDEQVLGLGLQGRNAPRPAVAPTVAPTVAPEPIRPPAATRGQGPQPPRAAPAPAPGLPTGLQGRNAPIAQPTPVPAAVTRPVAVRGLPGALGEAAEQRQAQAVQAAGIERPVSVRGQPDALGQAAALRQAQATEAAGVGTGIGIGRQGGEILRREGPGGVPEFFNEAADGGVAGAPETASAPTGFRSNTGQSAAEFLASMRAQDVAETARRQQQGAEARLGLERSALQAAVGRGTGNQRLAARQALRAFETQQLQATQEAGATERTGMTVAAEQERARQQAAANVLAAQAQAQGQLGAAELRGQFGLQAAQTAAEGRIGAAGIAATGPQAQEAAERTNILRARQELAARAAAAGDPNAQLAALGATPPRDVRIARDPITDRPVGTYTPRGEFIRYTPEEQLIADEAFAQAPR